MREKETLKVQAMAMPNPNEIWLLKWNRGKFIDTVDAFKGFAIQMQIALMICKWPNIFGAKCVHARNDAAHNENRIKYSMEFIYMNRMNVRARATR